MSTPYNPTGRARPYWLRTLALLALAAGLILAIAYAADSLFGPGTAELPRQVYQPTYPLTEPGWLEPTVTPGQR